MVKQQQQQQPTLICCVVEKPIGIIAFRLD